MKVRWYLALGPHSSEGSLTAVRDRDTFEELICSVQGGPYTEVEKDFILDRCTLGNLYWSPWEAPPSRRPIPTTIEHVPGTPLLPTRRIIRVEGSRRKLV